MSTPCSRCFYADSIDLPTHATQQYTPLIPQSGPTASSSMSYFVARSAVLSSPSITCVEGANHVYVDWSGTVTPLLLKRSTALSQVLVRMSPPNIWTSESLQPGFCRSL
ncbi:hypothetical protein CERSUDRAFT_116698 [Gelatoporia subvermispora B]|uniref:Uncharacterized protein n=1 Tax=Ceriporiopsis subvermispora (strain B) TaxID=914234 RepID=M2R796_CERS8|nr:hypothetical protein CERSUDRAFT_116698 [Gelatoporia subvermispora B]